MKRRHLTIFVVLASFAAIGYGFYIFEDEPKKGNTCIGAGTAGLFLLGMPLFLADVSRGKKAKDYMLTDENIRKMQGKEPKNTENQ
ncbi:hypothetical protein [Sediminicola luteus]|jgi:hypothetical protein|uniref:Isoleucyl-tRNA synthetase n=1 Tax=Sediminicola luteus TaxID=319238 RepID=A0A2A4GE78_9FLAO|nr:hypothetical protein [Sediminicola luteus]PCE66304.1 hypothetical protein B7P33_03115 [Sediminicola luteus]